MQFTTDQIEEYKRRNNCPWLTEADVKNSPIVQGRIKACIDAGENIMGHHKNNVTEHGMDGATQMFENLRNPCRMKYVAGSFLRKAKEMRLSGSIKDAATCLDIAATMRLRALRVSSQSREV